MLLILQGYIIQETIVASLFNQKFTATFKTGLAMAAAVLANAGGDVAFAQRLGDHTVAGAQISVSPGTQARADMGRGVLNQPRANAGLKT
jgi:hypothetical protein